MKVFAVPADESACGYYRIQSPARVVGPDVHVAPPEYPRHKGPEEVPVKLEPGDAEVVVVHRPAFPAIVNELERLQTHGYPVVVDVDDDLSCAPRGNVGNSDMADCQARACELADLVTCSSDALAARYGAHGRVRVLRNAIPAAMLDLPHESDGRTLGWAGLASGHLGDLPVAAGVVDEALRSEGWRFKVIGPAEDVRIQLALSTAPLATGPLRFSAYREAIGSLDMGIVPLRDTPFNAAKSFLKGLEYAARGVPFVASPLPEYERLASEGVGVIGLQQLGDLMRDESRRLYLVEAARQIVTERHTYEGNATRWLEAWQAAIDYRRSRP